MCGAGPYWGTLQLLWLLLGSMFLHHTPEPVRPCWSFRTCAHAMRDIQSFHQDTHSWGDIGCSFMVGSVGYLCENQGWPWVSAHTEDCSTKGFSAGIIWDFSSTLLDPDTLALVQDELQPCAVHSGCAQPDFTLPHTKL
ncbi:N-acetylmuramoyl-L-alanine amidase [Lonchura striata]|uniref:N-acetylmuramoyl-L-alanine amidase n=1 Tax=Lonchura striata TaxID=40157 RepID=A0A218U810_9PASE|nr:N-acetylmuramoyl-L-alanine amidase [Lonchura striata domestica]